MFYEIKLFQTAIFSHAIEFVFLRAVCVMPAFVAYEQNMIRACFLFQ